MYGWKKNRFYCFCKKYQVSVIPQIILQFCIQEVTALCKVQFVLCICQCRQQRDSNTPMSHRLPSPNKESEKLKNGVEVWCRSRSFQKGGLALFLFSFFKVFHFIFRNYFTFAKLCYAFEGKSFFFCHHNFKKKGHSSCLRMPHQLR